MSKIIQFLNAEFNAKSDLINDFFNQKFAQNPPLFYNSVDLRHNGHKIAPIDTNCFPAGFNNIANLEKAQKIAQNYLENHFLGAKNIMIIPENHTRNLAYLENVKNLEKILKNDQNQVITGSMLTEIDEKTTIEGLTLHKIHKNGDKITTDGFTPDLIILNNDLTGGVPEILQNIDIPITPPTKIGWHQRSKSQHFSIYNQLAAQLCQILEIDPWLISTMHKHCQKVNFKSMAGLDCLAKHVNSLLNSLKEKHQQYQIPDAPYCFVKADSGTYGMAVMQVNNAEQILDLNKKGRNKMNMLKESTQNTTAIVQEGIATIDKIQQMPAEPMIYMINAEIAANLARANSDRTSKNSLNAAGAQFFDLENLNDDELCLGCTKENITKTYSVIAKLAALASSIELNLL